MSSLFRKVLSFLCFFLKEKYFLNNLLVKKLFFREKTSFYLLLFFLHYLHCFLEREGGGKSCQFSIVFENFLLCFTICFHGKNFTFFLVSFPFFLSFSCPFFLLRSRRSDGRCQNTSSREKSEANGGNGHQGMKKVLCWRVFEHHRRSELMDQSQPRRLRPSAGYFRQRFSNSMFLVID